MERDFVCVAISSYLRRSGENLVEQLAQRELWKWFLTFDWLEISGEHLHLEFGYK